MRFEVVANALTATLVSIELVMVLERVMPTYIPIQDVIATAGVSSSTIDRWRRRNVVDSYRSPGVDRQVYIDLDQLLDLRRNPPLERLERRHSEGA